MFTDPQSVTINAVPTSLPRVSTGESQSIYKSADDTIQLRVSHQKSRSRTRRMIRLDNTEVATDPLTSESAYQTAGVYLVIDEPEYGFTDTELGYLVQGLIDWATTANIAKVLGSET